MVKEKINKFKLLKLMYQRSGAYGKISWKDILKCYSKQTGRDNEDIFAEDIEELVKILESEDKVKLPNKFYWNVFTRTPYPKWVRLKRNELITKKEKAWKSRIWSIKLEWVPGLKRMNSKTLEHLQILDDYYKQSKTPFPIAIPEKERSLQLFGDEKLLLSYAHKYKSKCDLYDLTNSYQTHLPLPYIHFACNDNRVLIIENMDTFYSVCNVLRNSKKSPYSHVIYGAGLNLIRQKGFLFIPYLLKKPKTLEYFGDIDPTGFYIPQQLEKSLQECNKQWKVVLNIPLYQLLIEQFKKLELEFQAKKQRNPYSLSSFSDSDREFIKKLFLCNLRIPQELVNYVILKAHFESSLYLSLPS